MLEFPRNPSKYKDNASLENRLLAQRQPRGDLRDASPDSFSPRSPAEKQLETYPRRLRHTAPPYAAPEAWQRAKDPSVRMRNGNYQDTKSQSVVLQTPPKKERKAGFRNTLRRMFTRRSTRNRISMPNPTVYPRHVSRIKQSLQATIIISKQGSGGIYHLCNRSAGTTLCLCTNQRCPTYQWSRISSAIPKGLQLNWHYKQRGWKQ